MRLKSYIRGLRCEPIHLVESPWSKQMRISQQWVGRKNLNFCYCLLKDDIVRTHTGDIDYVKILHKNTEVLNRQWIRSFEFKIQNYYSLLLYKYLKITHKDR